MITAVDTNVLIDFFTADPTFGKASRRALAIAFEQGQVSISPIVETEFLTAYPEASTAKKLLSELGIKSSAFSSECAANAANAWREYRTRRQSGAPRRIAADFLIGAHAEITANRLLTRDTSFYRRNFPMLEVIAPDTTK